MANVPKPNIVWKGAHPSNFTVGRPNGGRNGQETFHHVVGSADSAVAVFNNPSRGASSHFVVTDVLNLIYQCVDLNNTAWTDGNWASNLRAITVEHHGDWRNGYNNPTVAENAAKLVAWLRDQGLVNHAIRHRQVATNGTICPADLPVEAIWNRATAIINEYNNVDNRPQWLKDRKTLNTVVYAQKDSIYLRNLNDPSKPFDARRWGVNQDFTIGSYTVIGGKKYFITRSSTDTNAAAGLLEGDVKTERYVAPPVVQPVTLVDTENFSPSKRFTVNQDTVLVDIPANTKATVSGKVDYKAGEVIEDVAQLLTYSNGTRFYRTRYSVEKAILRGFGASKLTEIVPVEEEPVAPVKEVPAWVDTITEEPSRPMYVLRATPLIDLEDGHPYVDPKTNKEVWFNAGDVVEKIVASVIIEGTTYRLTEFAFKKTKEGEWKQFANGINSADLSTNPEAAPEGTPANPVEGEDNGSNSSGSDYLKENNTILKAIWELLQSLYNKVVSFLSGRN